MGGNFSKVSQSQASAVPSFSTESDHQQRACQIEFEHKVPIKDVIKWMLKEATVLSSCNKWVVQVLIGVYEAIVTSGKCPGHPGSAKSWNWSLAKNDINSNVNESKPRCWFTGTPYPIGKSSQPSRNIQNRNLSSGQNWHNTKPILPCQACLDPSYNIFFLAPTAPWKRAAPSIPAWSESQSSMCAATLLNLLCR